MKAAMLITGGVLVVVMGLASGHGSTLAEGSAVPNQDADPRQTVIRHTDTTSSLADRWTWAKAEAGRMNFDKGYWICYSVEKQIGECSFIGSCSSDEHRNHPTLGELLTGIRVNAVKRFEESERPQRMVTKELGLLFHVGDGSGDGRTDEIDGLRVSNLSLQVDLYGELLIWIGGPGYEESIKFLEGAFKQTKSPEEMKEFMVAIGLHNESKRATELLKQVLLGSGEDDLREDAAF